MRFWSFWWTRVGIGVVVLAAQIFVPARPASADQVINGCTIASNPTPIHLTSCPGVNLARANLARADLTRAKLTGADLTRAKLTGATLSGATLTEVSWSETTCPDGTNSDDNGGTCEGHLSLLEGVEAPTPTASPVVPELPPPALFGSGLLLLGGLASRARPR